METRLILDRSAAQALWNELNLGTDSTQNPDRRAFDDLFAAQQWVYVHRLDCQFKLVYVKGVAGYSLEFDRYLPDVPEPLTQLDIVPVGAEIRRYNSAPTKAIAGWYMWSEGPKSATATVKHFFPTQYSPTGEKEQVAPLYAQNILVEASSLSFAREFHSQVSQGLADRFRMDTWE